MQSGYLNTKDENQVLSSANLTQEGTSLILLLQVSDEWLNQEKIEMVLHRMMWSVSAGVHPKYKSDLEGYSNTVYQSWENLKKTNKHLIKGFKIITE